VTPETEVGCAEGRRSSGRGVETQMDRKSTWQRVSSAASGKVRHEASPSLRSEPDATLRLSRGETLILVLLLSLGLWALIWGGVSVLGACGLR
jgi:hypothetical protein